MILPKIKFSEKDRTVEFYIGLITFMLSWGIIIVKADNFPAAFAFGWIPAALFATLAVFVWQMKFIFIGAASFLAIFFLYYAFR